MKIKTKNANVTSTVKKYFKNISSKDFKINIIDTVILLAFFSIFVAIVEIIIHFNDADTTFRDQQVAIVAFSTTGFFGLLATGKGKRLLIKEAGGWARILGETAIVFIAVFVAQILVQFFLQIEKLAIYDIEIYLFYVNIAIGETLLFHGFLMAVLNIGFKENGVIVVIINAVIFALAHFAVYGEIIEALITVLIAGFIWAITIQYTSNIFAVMISHVLNNIIAAGVIIRNSILEFSCVNFMEKQQISTILLLMLSIMLFFLVKFLVDYEIIEWFMI